jgi:hypothetical protein
MALQPNPNVIQSNTFYIRREFIYAQFTPSAAANGKVGLRNLLHNIDISEVTSAGGTTPKHAAIFCPIYQDTRE